MYPTVLLASILVAALRGGHWRRLAETPWRRLGLIILAQAIQAVLAQAGRRDWTAVAPLALWMHLFSYLLLFAAIWANRRLPGMPWIGLGTMANFAVIAANGWRMPVSAEGLAVFGGGESAAFLAGHGDFLHSLQTEDTRLAFLGDVLHLPPSLHIRQLFSIGDVLIGIGIFLLIQTLMLAPGGGTGQSRRVRC